MKWKWFYIQNIWALDILNGKDGILHTDKNKNEWWQFDVEFK